MNTYIIIARFVNKDYGAVETRFVLDIKDHYMADVFGAVSDFEDGEDVSDDEQRIINGSTYSSLEDLISNNPDSFTAQWLEDGTDNLNLEDIHTIFDIS